MASRVKVEGIREVTAAATALKAVDREVRTQVNRNLRSAAGDIWNQSEVDRLTRTRMDKAVFRGTSVRARANGVSLLAATRPGIPGLDPAAVEFGDPNKTYETYSRKGGKVRRRTQQQLPGPVRKGRVVHQGFKRAIPRVVSLYVQTVVRTIYDAWEVR
jgi:hypothetical protein